MEISYGQKLMENSWNSFKNISWDISVRGVTASSSVLLMVCHFAGDSAMLTTKHDWLIDRI